MGPTRSPVPRSRVPWHRRLRTDPRAVRRWLVVLALAGATAASVAHAAADGRRARREWGRLVPVLVLVAPVAAEDPLDAAAVLRDWPATLAPDGVLTRLPPGARARLALPAGTPLTAALLAAAPGRDRSDRPVVAVPRLPASPAVAVDDRVDLWDVSGVRARVVSRGAWVTVVRGEAVEVAVAADDLDDVVGAVALEAVVLVKAAPG